MSKESTYWWAEENPEEVVNRLDSYSKAWAATGTNPFAQAWYRNTVAYYSSILEPNHWESSLGYRGEQGELIKMVLPQARSLIRQIITIVTKQKLSFTAIAETSDKDISKDLAMANAKIEEIIKEQQLDRLAETVAEHTCIYGMGFFKIGWRSDKGMPYMANPITKADGSVVNTTVYDGDLEITTPVIFDITYDNRIPDFKDNDWVCVSTLKNRWTLIAQYPELEQEILAVPPMEWYQKYFTTDASNSEFSSDLICVKEAYHRPTAALPDGRMVVFASSEAIFYDDVNPYKCIPIVCVKPEGVPQIGYGYPILSNLLPAQEMFDHCLSAISTNQAALAVQSVLVPRGAEINSQDVGGMNWISYTPQGADGGGKPEPLQLTASAPETFKFAEFLDKYMTAVSGLNSTIRGQPPAGLTSGTAIATMSANAIEFLNSLSKSLDMAIETVMYKACQFTQDFAQVPRDLIVTGKNNKSSTKAFTGKTMSIVKRIKINRSNPLMQTLSGRMEMAQQLLQTGLIKNPTQYFNVIEGAPTQDMFDNELAENDLIASENEDLMMGKMPPVLITDSHAMHIYEHNKLLKDPNVRSNAEYVQLVLEHMSQHEQLSSANPYLQAMAQTGKMPEGGPPPPSDNVGAEPMASPNPAMNQPQVDTAEPATDNLGRGA